MGHQHLKIKLAMNSKRRTRKQNRKMSHLKKRALLTRKTNGVKNQRRARFRTNKRNERKRKSQRKRLSKSNQLTYQNQNWLKLNFLSTKVQRRKKEEALKADAKLKA